jgi:hypothetical protein
MKYFLNKEAGLSALHENSKEKNINIGLSEK